MPLKLPFNMTASYENSAAASYLVINTGDAAPVVWYQVSMLECSQPSGYLHFETRHRNGSAYFCYDITSKLTLRFFLKRKKLKRNEFIKLLSDLTRPLVGCEGFLLWDTGFLLDPDFIYINPESTEAFLAYLPVRAEGDTTGACRSFISDLILNHACIEEDGADNYLQRILGFIKRDNFSLGEFLLLLEELLYANKPEALAFTGTNTVPETVKPVAADAGNEASGGEGAGRLRLAAAVVFQVMIAVVLLVFRKLPESNSKNPGVTWAAIAVVVAALDVLLFKKLFFAGFQVKRMGQGDGSLVPTKAGMEAPAANIPAPTPVPVFRKPVQARTELLSVTKPACPLLKSRNSPDYEEIRISKPEFVIGRLRDQVDHVCSNNAIGKVHAMVTLKGETVFLRDLNSVNGTFINGERIESNKDVEIKDSDMITLANSEYLFVSP